ncbi:MAG: TatD family hydrolase [Myxococcales bacterium]
MIDTHCHFDTAAFDADRDEVLARARAAGVTDIVVPAIGPESWEPLLTLAARTPGVHAGLGIHPQLLPELPPRDDDRHLADLDAWLARGGAVAVGECGLDGPSAEGAPMDRQLAVLRGHLALARKHRLPVLLHCLRAHEPLIRLLSKEAKLPASGVLHSYSGGADHVRKYAGWDLYFSFAGPVTYENARKVPLAVRAVPPERLLLETDAPDQTPRPHRGRCEPAHLPEVARGVAAALGSTIEEVEAQTDANARRLFGLAR